MPGGSRAMTTRFPAPWRIVEIPNGFAVDDASGQQLGVFYGRADPNAAGHTGFLTLEEARQLAVEFARLPELLEQTSASQRGRQKPRLSAEHRCKNRTERRPEDNPSADR